MKTVLRSLLCLLALESPALAHQKEGGSTEGIFGLSAEYVHVLLNPVPVYGLLFGAVVLMTGLVLRSQATRNTGLVLVILSTASAWPVTVFGQRGYNHLFDQLDTESQQWLDAHMARAESLTYVFYTTAALGAAALLAARRFPKGSTILAALTLFGSAGSLAAAGFISRAGGQVSHSEFRTEGVLPEKVEKEQIHNH